MKSHPIAIASLAFAILSTSASAITFDFRSAAQQEGASYGNALTFTQEDLSVRASAWSWNTNANRWENGWLGQSSSYGLYNTNSPTDNSHTFDNQGWLDFALFEFDHVVSIQRLLLRAFGDTDMNYFIGSRSPDRAPEELLEALDWNDLTRNLGGNSSRWANLPEGQTGNYLILGADIFNAHDLDDRFKIERLEIERVHVPDAGATALLLGLGLATVFAFKKRLQG